MSLGKRIKELRGADTLQDFCNRIDNMIKPANLSSIERDQSKPSLDVLTKISEVYNCSLDWLLRGIGEKSPGSGYVLPTPPVSPDLELMTKYLKVLEENSELQKRLNKEQEKEIEKLQAANSGVKTPQ